MDPKPKKVLILYASAGHGHEKAAKALLEACQTQPGKVSALLKDTIKLSPKLGGLYKNFYLRLVAAAPRLWGFFYYSTDIGWFYRLIRPARRLMNALTGKALERLLLSEDPDVVICTHFMSTEVSSHLKKKGKLRARLVTVVTDYLPHYVWIGGAMDLYCVATEKTKAELIRRGATAEKVRVCGIPIEKKFTAQKPADAIRQRYGLDAKTFTVLVTSGGAGIGAMRGLVEKLLRSCASLQVLAVAGTNRELYEQLSATGRNEPRLKAFAFVDNMDELMDASDILVGRGGALTITEGFAKAKPALLFRSVPGQERRNAHEVKEAGAGFFTDSVEEAVAWILGVAKDPQAFAKAKEKAHALFHPDAARRIVEGALNG